VELGVPADVVVRARMELAAVLVIPGVRRVVAVLDEDGPSVPVLLLTRHKVAALQEQDTEAGWREPGGKRPATRASPDDGDVVLVIGRHAESSSTGWTVKERSSPSMDGDKIARAARHSG